MFSSRTNQFVMGIIVLVSIFSCASQNVKHLYVGKRKPMKEVATIVIFPSLAPSGVVPNTSVIVRQGMMTQFGPSRFSGATLILSIDDEPIENFIGEKAYSDQYCVLPGNHRIGVSYWAFGIGKKTSSAQYESPSGARFGGGIEKFVNVRLEMDEPIILEVNLEAGVTYLLQTDAAFDACRFSIEGNGMTIVEKETTNLNVTVY